MKVRSLSSSNFLEKYKIAAATFAPTHKSIHTCASSLIIDYCNEQRISTDVGAALCRQLVEFTSKDRSPAQLEAPDAAGITAMRIWTSDAYLGREGASRLEFCSILNWALREDHPVIVFHVACIVRVINTTIQADSFQLERLPLAEHGMVFRGGSLPEAALQFFLQNIGRHFRIPTFLSTTPRIEIARWFMERAHSRMLPVVLWRIRLDPRGITEKEHRCRHVSLVSIREFEFEQEFLFVPYSTFRVLACVRGQGTLESPHEITLMAENDNLVFPNELPLAPHS